MKHKYEVFTHFIALKTLVENQLSYKITILQTNGGKEYCNNKFNQFLGAHGIFQQINCPYTPKQNGVIERKHLHLMLTTKTLLQQYTTLQFLDESSTHIGLPY